MTQVRHRQHLHATCPRAIWKCPDRAERNHERRGSDELSPTFHVLPRKNVLVRAEIDEFDAIKEAEAGGNGRRYTMPMPQGQRRRT